MNPSTDSSSNVPFLANNSGNDSVMAPEDTLFKPMTAAARETFFEGLAAQSSIPDYVAGLYQDALADGLDCVYVYPVYETIFSLETPSQRAFLVWVLETQLADYQAEQIARKLAEVRLAEQALLKQKREQALARSRLGVSAVGAGGQTRSLTPSSSPSSSPVKSEVPQIAASSPQQKLAAGKMCELLDRPKRSTRVKGLCFYADCDQTIGPKYITMWYCYECQQLRNEAQGK
jgi:hypothetical protein